MKRHFIILILSVLGFTSCGNDDDSPTCNVVDSLAEITINNNQIEFTKGGYGLNILPSGRHKLDLRFNIINAAEGDYGSMRLTMLFRDTGTDMINECNLFLASGFNVTEVNFSNGNFTSEIISNNPNCFEANFSGTVETPDGTFTLTNGYASFVYNEPLSDYSFGKLDN